MYIQRLSNKALDQATFALAAVKDHMLSQGLHQWDDTYPSRELLHQDIVNNQAYGLYSLDQLVGYMVLNEFQDMEYQALNWQYPEPSLVIHRLFILPSAQGKGYSSRFLQFAESYAKTFGYTSIRLDAYSLNETANALYKNKNYQLVGQVDFRKGVFNCFEKSIARV